MVLSCFPAEDRNQIPGWISLQRPQEPCRWEENQAGCREPSSLCPV